ncbi:VanZ family protein [Streptomyces sp. NPDC045470]|uniref:VanZ family protein n=1 Tax=Streptomyces sp. NPDC045470 TaxID=3155469 RepID=UPI0033E023DA
MIEASVGALPGLIPAFLIAAALLGMPAFLIAKLKRRPVGLPLLLATFLAGVIAVTMMPGVAGTGQAKSCDTGLPGLDFLTSESAQLNILLFVPVSFLAVLLFRRPVLVLAATLTLTCGIELVQGWTELGRSCSYDDIKANALGGALGLLLGCLYLWGRQRRLPFTRKDALWGVGAVVAVTAFGAVLFQSTLTRVNYEELHARAKADFGDPVEKQEWLAKTVKELYGSHAEVGETEIAKLAHDRWRMRATTDRGAFVATWPDRKLVEMTTEGKPDEGGNLTAADMQKAAERFARKWFPGEITGADIEFRPVVKKHEGGMRLLSYRRYSRDVMMPMRLDIIVTPAGRVVSLTARSITDPDLPDVTVGKTAAKRQAEHVAPGTQAKPVSLMAQRVNGVWRPVWLIGLRPKNDPNNVDKETSVFLDAVTGEQVTPEKLDEDDSSPSPSSS